MPLRELIDKHTAETTTEVTVSAEDTNPSGNVDDLQTDFELHECSWIFEAPPKLMERKIGLNLMNKKLQQMLNKPYLIDVYYLKQVDDQLFEVVKNLQQGDRELVKLNVNNQLLQLSVQGVAFKLQGKPFKLISLQNIQNELEAQELISWQKLIRILTHEIMNSVTPIASLATTINDMLTNPEEMSEENREDIKEAINAINRRSEGLLRFTETYRNLTRIPPPSF